MSKLFILSNWNCTVQQLNVNGNDIGDDGISVMMGYQ